MVSKDYQDCWTLYSGLIVFYYYINTKIHVLSYLEIITNRRTYRTRSVLSVKGITLNQYDQDSNYQQDGAGVLDVFLFSFTNGRLVSTAQDNSANDKQGKGGKERSNSNVWNSHFL